MKRCIGISQNNERFKYHLTKKKKMDYKELLTKAKKEMPATVHEKERFEIPNVTGHVEGNKTIITNFIAIASILGREPAHLLKFVLKELATPGDVRGQAVVIGRKISSATVNEKIKKYAEEFVLCPECGKPDTKIIIEGGFSYLKCQACGAKHSVKSKI